jgi:formate-dependent nitrite reductase membrane component NrfD
MSTRNSILFWAGTLGIGVAVAMFLRIALQATEDKMNLGMAITSFVLYAASLCTCWYALKGKEWWRS